MAEAKHQAQSNTARDTLAKKSESTDVVSGGHLVAKALKAEGVDTIFTLCGGHIIDIYDGCIDEGIRIVDVRHEQVAAHAADGYARQTGRLGCVVTTAGPGCTNAMTGIFQYKCFNCQPTCAFLGYTHQMLVHDDRFFAYK